MQTTSSKKDKSKLSKLLREKARTKKIVVVLICIIALSIAFILGFAFRSQITLMTKLGIPVGEESSLNTLKAKSSDSTSANKSMKSVYNSLSQRIDEVEDILSQNAMSSVELDEASTSCITEILKSTGDDYAKFYSASEYTKLIDESKANNYSGVGILLNEMNGKCYVADVFSGSEADLKGVKAGDYIKSINGVNVTLKSSSEVRNIISEQLDKVIMINFVHPLSNYGDSGQEYSVALQVTNMDVDNVVAQKQDDIVFITIHQFTDETSNVVSSKVKELDGDDVRAFVIDVRGNPGGYMTGALDCASSFLTGGTLVTIETVQGNSDRTAEGETITTKPIVILANSNTSSAAEVFVAALHDNSRVSVVGQKTAGKGTVATTRELSFGGAIRYTAARYITPSGNPIQANGVKPDIEVANIDDLAYDSDELKTALDSAISIIAG